MRSHLFSIALLAGTVVVVSPFVLSQSNSKKQTAPARKERSEKAGQRATDHSADEAAIRANVATFLNAYNAKDSQAIAALFMPDGQIEDKVAGL